MISGKRKEALILAWFVFTVIAGFIACVLDCVIQRFCWTIAILMVSGVSGIVLGFRTARTWRTQQIFAGLIGVLVAAGTNMAVLHMGFNFGWAANIVVLLAMVILFAYGLVDTEELQEVSDC